MIDRSSPIILLRPKVWLASAGISGGLFAALLLTCLVCWVAGALAWLLCWLSFIVLCGLGYALVMAAVGLVVFVVIALDAERETNQAGCGPILVGGVIVVWICGKGWPWMTSLLEPFRICLVGIQPSTGWDDVSYSMCDAAATFLLQDVFIGHKVYLYSWTILALTSIAAVTTRAVLGLLALERPLKTVFRRIRYRCNKCGSTRLQFRCTGSGCVAWHDDLEPSIYGLFTAQCQRCKTSLPTTDFGGRLKLTQSCANPKCGGATVSHTGSVSEFHFALVGAQSSGKSCYLFAAVWQFLDFASANRLTVEFPDPSQKREFDDYVNRFRAGRPIPKTVSQERPLAFTLDVVSPNGAHSRLYLYDAAGEDYEAGDLSLGAHGIGGFDFFSYIDGILFIVDPMAEECAGKPRPGDNPANTESAHLLARLMPFLERAQKTIAGRKILVPVAFVVTKADGAVVSGETIPLLSQLPRRSLIAQYTSIASAASDAAANSLTVRGFLQKVGAGDVVQTIESAFCQTRCFAVSSLGRSVNPRDSSSFLPAYVADPLIWLSYQSHAITDTMHASRTWRNGTEFFLRSLRGLEGATVQWSARLLVMTLLSVWTVFCWYLGGPNTAVCGALVAILSPFTAARFKSRQVLNLVEWKDAIRRFVIWEIQSLSGRNDRRGQAYAIVVVFLLLAIVAGTGFAVVWTWLS